MVGAISGAGYSPYAVSLYTRQQQAEQTRQARTAQDGSAWAVRRPASPETPVQPVSPVRRVSADEASIPALLSRMENDPAAMAGRMRIQYGGVTPEGRFAENGGDAVRGPELAALEGRLSRAEDALARNDLTRAGGILKQDPPAQGAADLPEARNPGAKNPGAKNPGAKNPGEEKLGAEKQAAERAENGSEAGGVQGAQKALEEGECQTCKERKYQDGSDDPGVSFKTPTNIAPEQAASAVRGHEMEHVYREQAKAEREDRKVVSQTVTMHTEICPECGESFVSGGTTRTVTKADTDNAAQQDLARQSREEEKTRTPFSAVA